MQRVTAVVLVVLCGLANPDRGCGEAGADARVRVVARAGGSGSIAEATATRVIELAERWAGQTIAWGDGGQLLIVAGDSELVATRACYGMTDRTVRLGLVRAADARDGSSGRLIEVASVPDAVAHEAGHAVLHAVKPGWRRGMSLVLHEGLSDAVAFLAAFADREAASRVWRQTAGDLTVENEASRLMEGLGDAGELPQRDGQMVDDGGCMRSAAAVVSLQDCGLYPEQTSLALSPLTGGTSDPHRLGQIVCGALYEVFVGIVGRSVEEGDAAEPAIEGAVDEVGSLIMRALSFMRESTVALRDFGLAMLRADRDGNGCRRWDLIERALARRGVLDAGRDALLADLQAMEDALPEFVLDPAVARPDEVLRKIEDLEALLLERVTGAATASSGEACTTIRPIRHGSRLPFAEEALPSELAVSSDVMTESGLRVIRIAYRVRGLASVEAGEEIQNDDQGGLFFDVVKEQVYDVYVSLVFDLWTSDDMTQPGELKGLARQMLEVAGSVHDHWLFQRARSTSAGVAIWAGEWDEARRLYDPIIRDHPVSSEFLGWVLSYRTQIE